MLSRDQIIKASDTRTAPVAVPEWGGDICVRVLSGAERDRLEAAMQPDKNGRKNYEQFRARFAALVICDESGARLFEDKDVPALGAKSSVVLDRIMEAGMRINAMSQADVTDLVGESAGDRNAASGSGSPVTSA